MDFVDFDKLEDVVELFFFFNMVSGEVFKSNICMICNWLVGCVGYWEIGEEEDFYVFLFIVLMGKVYIILMFQVIVGKKYGGINEIDVVVFLLKKSEIL